MRNINFTTFPCFSQYTPVNKEIVINFSEINWNQLPPSPTKDMTSPTTDEL